MSLRNENLATIAPEAIHTDPSEQVNLYSDSPPPDPVVPVRHVNRNVTTSIARWRASGGRVRLMFED